MEPWEGYEITEAVGYRGHHRKGNSAFKEILEYFTPSHPMRVSREGTIFSNPDVVLPDNTLMQEFQTFRNVRNEFLLFIICLTQCGPSSCLLYHISKVHPFKDCIIFHYMCISHFVYSIVKNIQISSAF